MATTQNALKDLLNLSDTQRQKREREQRLRDAQGAPTAEQAPEAAQAPVDPQAQAKEEAKQFLAANVKVPVKQHTPETALKFHASLLELGDRKTAKKYQQERASGQLAEPREVVGDIRSITAFEAASLGWTNELIRDEKVRKWVDGDLSGISAKEYLHMEQAYDQRTGFLRQDYVVNRENIAQRVVENLDNSNPKSNAFPGGPEDRDNILAHLQSFVEAQLTEIDSARSELRSPREVDWSAVKRQIDEAGLPIAIPDFQAMAQQLLSEAITAGTSVNPKPSAGPVLLEPEKGRYRPPPIVPESVKAILQDIVSAQMKGVNLPGGPSPVDWDAVETQLEGTGVSLFEFHDLVENVMGRIMIRGTPKPAAGPGSGAIDKGKRFQAPGVNGTTSRTTPSSANIERFQQAFRDKFPDSAKPEDEPFSEFLEQRWTWPANPEPEVFGPPSEIAGIMGFDNPTDALNSLERMRVKGRVSKDDYQIYRDYLGAPVDEAPKITGTEDEPFSEFFGDVWNWPPDPSDPDIESFLAGPSESASIMGFDSPEEALAALERLNTKGRFSQRDYEVYRKILGEEPEQ